MDDSEAVGPRTNVVISVIILVACALAWLATSTLPRGLTVDPIGPAYFPRFIILSTAALAAALLVTSLRDVMRPKPSSERAPPDSPLREAVAADLMTGTASAFEAEAELPPISYPRMIAVLALSIAYVLLMGTLGYFLATACYVVALLLLLRVRNGLAIAGCALGTPLVLEALFNKLLSVPLPGGVLDYLPFQLPF